jgi:hypothetical protein
MGVVQLNGKALMKGVEALSAQALDIDHVLQGAGDEEVLLR